MRFLCVRHHTDGARDFILGGQSLVEERNHVFFAAAGEGDAEEHFLDPRGRARGLRHVDGLDAELLARIARFLRVRLGLLHDQMDVIAARGVELAQERQHVFARLDVVARHILADVGLDEHRPVGRNFLDECLALLGQRVQPLGGHVGARTGAGDQDLQRNHRHHDGDRARGEMQTQAPRVRGDRPVAASHQDHVQVQHDRRDADEVDDGGQAEDAVRKFIERREGRHVRAQVLRRLAENPEDAFGVHEERAEQRAQDERHRGVGGQSRREHAHRDEHRSHEPVADVVGEHETDVGFAQPEQHDQVRQREQHRARVHTHRREILAEHDFEIGGREREEQLFGSLLALVGPHTHGDGGHEEEQQVREDVVELLQVGQVVQEETVLPERGRGGEKDEQRDENVAGRIREIQAQIAAHDRAHHRPIHVELLHDRPPARAARLSAPVSR